MRASPRDPRAAARRAPILVAEWMRLAPAVLAARTLARRMSAMRQFYKFLLLEGVRQDDPTAELDTPRLGRPLPKIVSETEVKALFDAAKSWPGEEGIRVGCILEVLYATGLR